MIGLEPTCLAAPDPKSGASANFATFALYFESFTFRRLADVRFDVRLLQSCRAFQLPTLLCSGAKWAYRIAI